MKTLILSALVATLAVPAVANESVIAKFNSSKDASERVLLDTTASSRANIQEGVLAHFNMDADSQDDVHGTNGVTVLSASNVAGADIFARIKAESAENE